MKTLVLILASIIGIPLIYWSGVKEGYKEGFIDGYTDMRKIHNPEIQKSDSIYNLKHKK
jgi:hypothetical protein